MAEDALTDVQREVLGVFFDLPEWRASLTKPRP